jgi:uncharacterized damage-inducible protein DinB
MTETLRETLLHEMETGVRTTCHLLDKAGDQLTDWWNKSLRDGTRSLGELVNHLVQIPAVDLAILREQPEDEVHILEATLRTETAEELKRTITDGFAALSKYYEEMDEETLLTKTSKAFYAEEGATQARWLVETLTHLFHHRAQFFTYLKTFGLDIDMFDLY